MKKSLFSIISLLLALLMIAGVFASCTGGGGDTEDPTESESSSSTQGGSEDESSEKEDSSDDSSEEPPVDGALLEGLHAPLIEKADSLKNNVLAYFPDSTRDRVVYENMEMSLEYALAGNLEQQVTYLKNKEGKSYIENTMDVFITMDNGKTYYAKNSYSSGVPNIYRFGYYYYHMRVEGQNFIENMTATSEKEIKLTKPVSTNEIKAAKLSDGILKVLNESAVADPYIVISNSLNIDTSAYTVLEITMKADANTGSVVDVFYIAGESTAFNGGQMLRVNIVPDGTWRTYLIPIYSGPDYKGALKGLRLDVNGAGAQYEISDIKFKGVDVDGAPKALSMSRNFNIYSDKMHQVIQVAATEETTGIKAIGFKTAIPEDKVSKVVVADKDGIHYTFEGVDWSSAEYVGFDIADAGIFGYILPYDGKGGSISVELVGGEYVITQSMTPEGGKIIPSRTDYNEEKKYYNWVAGGNTNDFYIGNRIYTDANHDFTEFLEEAYCERNPLSEKNFKVYENASTDASYAGYDSLRGCYRFNLAGAKGGFSTPYYQEPNKHYRVNFTVRGDDYDRQVYILTHTTVGQLECATLMDENDVMLPVPLEVGKNFSEQSGERNLYNLDDATYGEVIFPLVIEAKAKYEYTVINLYQNWGKYPLKQLSWIQFFTPYYHLSTGVTETNCVLPWMFTDRTWYNTLPDHRGMSAPHWSTQPQHTSSGEHDWLRYVDSEGNVVRWENVKNTIDSYGPTYADVKMDYLTYDGKMKVSYTHTEMPQTDENRTYYEMTYEVLDDITINNCVTDLQFYKVDPNDPKGLYQKVGYLNEQNESVVVDANQTSTPVKYVLGDNCPYFSFFDMDNHSDPNGYGNLAFLVYNSEFTIGGEKAEPNFAIVNYKDTVYVTLNIEEPVTFKKGDKFIINAILLPWGSQLLEDGIVDEATNNYEYTMTLPDGSQYMDKNVRDVRENTLLSPITAVAEKDCEVMESVFVPKVKTTNGESAEFTLRGGYNNVAVRVYGFNKMTVPVIYEKIDGEWQVYEVSSRNADKDAHKYDGYCIHYDGDGTFSYSFVTDMDGEGERTFKIVADGNYTAWGKETVESIGGTDYLEVYADPAEIADTDGANMLTREMTSKYEVMSEEGILGSYDFLRIYGGGLDAEHGEGYIFTYREPTGSKGAGKYLAFMYRYGADNAETVRTVQFYLSTTLTAPNEDSMISTTSIINDGEWHVLIIDISAVEKPEFKKQFAPAADGKYYPLFIRVDCFDKRMSKDSYIDIAYMGMDSSYDAIREVSMNAKSIKLFEGKNEYIIDVNTGAKISTSVNLPEVLVDPSSGYTLSTLEYGGEIDYINGVVSAIEAGSNPGLGVGAYQVFGSAIADKSVENCATVPGYNLVFAGWSVVEGGIEKYVWSADGGKTWHDTTAFGLEPSKANAAMINSAYVRSGNTYRFTTADAEKGNFQGSPGNDPVGIALNLEQYRGQTVDVIFGAIPKKDTSSILPMFYIGQVKVAE